MFQLYPDVMLIVHSPGDHKRPLKATLYLKDHPVATYVCSSPLAVAEVSVVESQRESLAAWLNQADIDKNFNTLRAERKNNEHDEGVEARSVIVFDTLLHQYFQREHLSTLINTNENAILIGNTDHVDVVYWPAISNLSSLASTAEGRRRIQRCFNRLVNKKEEGEFILNRPAQLKEWGVAFENDTLWHYQNI